MHLTVQETSAIMMAMKSQNTIKRMSLYIPLELVAKVQQSAKIHRRSFNQEMLWLAEEAMESNRKASLAQTEMQLSLEPISKTVSNSAKGQI